MAGWGRRLRRSLSSGRSFGRLPLAVALTMVTGAMFARGQSVAPTNETILVNFDGTATNLAPSATGDAPIAGLVGDSSGNLYGTTSQGGTSVWGAVFDLVNSSGSYIEKLLHSFAGPPLGGVGADGTNPSSRLIMDSSGNLYGTTPDGGDYGLGTVFELANSSGTYTEKILYSFTGINGDGAIPYAVALVRDSAGNLYGTTMYGGSYGANVCAAGGCGTVFELANSGTSPGTYTEKVLYRFADVAGDTGFPQTGLAADQAGDFFGTSGAGGADGYGAVYELVNSSGSYRERVIYSFADINAFGGDVAAAPVITDTAGNLYGTTPGGGGVCNAGPGGCGTVFELVKSPTSPGTYTERILYTFQGGTDGAAPLAALTMDARGNLYGTTTVYGGTNAGGNVFELANVSGSYVFNVLYEFGGRLNDGFQPSGRLVMDSTGNLYGTTARGGVDGGGTVFRLSSTVPPSVPALWLSASNLTFTSVVGLPSASQSIKAADSGTASLTFDPSAITITGPNAPDFALSDGCSGQTFSPGATCQVSVTFTASAIGPESATLSFADNAADSPQAVSLSGTGFPAPVALFSPASLTFSPQLVHMTSGVQTVSVSNSGATNITFAAGSITLSGTNAADFAVVSDSCNGTNMFPASACSVGIAFTPSIVGTENATLSFVDNATGSPQTVDLTGTGASSLPGGGSLPQDEAVLHNFTGVYGGQPEEGLVSDASGDLYGTTSAGGNYACPYGCGTVFELVNSSGTYTERLLYSFVGLYSGGADGAAPESRLIMDSSGNLYGTTYAGGTSGKGTVFELVNSSGTYTEKVLYSFTGFAGDGATPLYGALYMDSAGNLYGTTLDGGGNGAGTVFELVNNPAAPGTYTEKVLYSFTNFIINGPGNGDGSEPCSGLTADNAGNLFGTTFVGGAYGHGAVYELVKSSGGYSERILYSFSGGSDGAYPTGSVTLDSTGNLYGATTFGGGSGSGTVFELVNSMTSPGTYTARILSSFTSEPCGGTPLASLMADAAGNLYGTTSGGGGCGGGTAFELASASGSYVFNNLHNFGSIPSDGANPQGRLIEDSAGNFYGTTYAGGTGGGGTVFRLRPSGPYVTLSPSNLMFASLTVGTPSAAETVTITNSGNENLTFASGAVAISGANAADFALSADNCSSKTVAPAGTCSVSVTFTPSTLSAESANLNFADNAGDSPQTVALSAAPPDFSIGVASGSSSSATVSPGGTATYSLSVGSLYGFARTVSLTCSGAPSEASCTVSPSSVNPISATPASVTVTVTTTAASSLPPIGPSGDHRWPPKLWLLTLGLLALVMLAARGATPTLGIKPTRRLRYGLAVILLGAAMFAACGGGGGGGGGGNPGTPVGTYTITVKGTSGSLTHSTSLTLTVN